MPVAYNIYVKHLIFFVVLAVSLGPKCFAKTEQVPKPACNARMHGQFWPDEANHGPDAARQLLQQGDLEMCSLVVWKYKWEHLSVNVRLMAKGRHSLTSEPRKADAQENR